MLLRIREIRRNAIKWKHVNHTVKTPKAQAARAEEFRRQLEHEQRQARLYRLTATGQDEFNRALEPIRDSIVKQAQLVRQLKETDALKTVLEPEIALLKKLRRELSKVEKELMPSDESGFNAAKFSALLKNRFFYTQSAELYGGSGGLVDYGPYGTKLKQNIIDAWRRHFLSGQNAIELDTAMITNEKILRASGHVDMFADKVVKDVENGECFRADKLIQAAVEKELSKDKDSKWKMILPRLDSMTRGEIDSTIEELNIKSPISGNNLSPSIDFNLMFPLKIGPEGKLSAYLRPETAQGIFANYKLLRNRQLPLTVGQVGHSFRNEISTGNGLVRTREFQMAEIEHFFDPEDSDGVISEEVKEKIIPVWSQQAQLSGHILSALTINDIMSLSDAGNHHLAVYLAKMFDFCDAIGIDTSRLRFRQQLNEELAHYSSICFDLECQLHTLDSAWLECAGLALRNDYDLVKHQNASGQTLTTSRPLVQPRVEHVRKVTIKAKQLKKKLGKKMAKRFNEIKTVIEREFQSIDENELATMKSFNFEGVELTLGEDIIITVEKQTIQSEQFLPHVIEPSFGISRLMQTTLEHCYRTRQADGRSFFTFPVSIAPIKCSILTIRKCDEMAAHVTKLSAQLEGMNVAYETDVSGAIIGRKYLKSDELGVPFVIVVDDDTLRHGSVTLRDRDTLFQVRIPLDRIPDCVELLIREKWTFDNLRERFVSQEEFLDDKMGPIAKALDKMNVESLTEYEAKLYIRQFLQ